LQERGRLPLGGDRPALDRGREAAARQSDLRS